MKNFFAPPAQRDNVQFKFAKSLPYTTRLYISLSTLLIGVVIQIFTLNPWVGLPFLLVTVVLNIVVGFDSRARLKTFQLDSNWTKTSIEKIKELNKLRKRSREWDKDYLDVSNASGCFVMVLLLGAGILAAVLFGKIASDNRISIIIGLDAVVLFVPMWFSGMKFIVKEGNLAIKIKIILLLADHFQTIKTEKETFEPEMLLSRKDNHKTIPQDIKFRVSFADSPKGFYGLQAQINVNVVQGHSYPYFYCVIPVKKGFGMARFKEKVNPPDNIVVEYQEDDNAEVLVIRQYTTKKSGYHTRDKSCINIFAYSMNTIRWILDNS